MKNFCAKMLLLGLLCPCVSMAAGSDNWPQFRGPRASGVAENAKLPTEWNVEKGENLRWQTSIPGLAHASPIVWEDHIYLTSAVNTEGKSDLRVGLYGDINSYSEKQKHAWRLLCIDKKSGKILWDKLAHEAVPRAERHTKATHCNSTPATDGKRIVALLGSEGLFCFDLQGELLWKKDLGKLNPGFFAVPTAQWGFASSPVLHQGKVIVQCDSVSEQFLAAFDCTDGRELWRTPRKDASTWCTPAIAKTDRGAQIIVNGWKEIGAYELETGKPVWWMKEGGDVPVASPIVAGDLAILTSAHGRYRPMRAVRLSATGDITPAEMGGTNQALVWSHPRKGSYMQTPIVVGNLLWGCTDDGVVTCFELHSGKIHYEERIGGGRQGLTASPVAAQGRLYFTGEQGDVFVIPASEKFSVLATNKLDGICLATPAISDNSLFFRTTEKLVAISAGK